MERTPLSIPELAIIAGTRAMLGAGLGLLLANRLNEDQRRAAGWTLFAVGAITTAPILPQLMSAQSRPSARTAESTFRLPRERQPASRGAA